MSAKQGDGGQRGGGTRTGIVVYTGTGRALVYLIPRKTERNIRFVFKWMFSTSSVCFLGFPRGFLVKFPRQYLCFV